MSCATIRTRSPARRTLPSSSVATPRRRADLTQALLPRLNGITDVREITLRDRILESWAITSSVMPSAKNSFSGIRAQVEERQHRDRGQAGREVAAGARGERVGERRSGREPVGRDPRERLS